MTDTTPSAPAAAGRLPDRPPLPVPGRRLALAGAWLLAAFLAGCGTPVDLAEVPRPDTATFEPAVREQLTAAFDAVDESSEEKRAEAFGDLGRALHAYELRDTAEIAYRNAMQLAPEKFDWTYLLGVVLQEQGLFEKAEQALERASEIRPNDLPARLRLAQTLIESNKLAEAERQLDQALQQDPECALAYFFKGQTMIATEDFDGAVAALQKVLSLQPQADSPYHALGRAYRALGDLEKAGRALERAGTREVHLSDPLFQALDELEISAAGYIRRAGRAQLAGAMDVALAEYRRAVESMPTHAEARAGLGATLAGLGQVDEAREHLTAALELGDDSAWLRYNLAGVHRLAGEMDAAIEQYRAAVELDGAYLDAWIGLAQVLTLTGRSEEAVGLLERRLEEGAEPAEIHLELAAIRATRGELGAARRHQQSALDGDPTPAQSARAHRQRARMASDSGQAERALLEYQKALAADPNDLESRFARANLLGAIGRLEEAAQEYRLVVSASPTNRAARIGEATALALLGRHDEATRRLTEGIERSPDDPELGHTLARLLLSRPDTNPKLAQRALEVMQRVTRQGGTVEMAQTQAAALAGAGRFDEAIELQGQVLEELRRTGNQDLLPQATALLEGYRRQAAR